MKNELFSRRHSVVPILGNTGPVRARTFLGTGIVVSPTSVLTCAHVLQELMELHPDQGEQLGRPFVQCGSTAYRAIGGNKSVQLDLCILHFSQLPNTNPVVPVRAGN